MPAMAANATKVAMRKNIEYQKEKNLAPLAVRIN